jgi:hypothetical protein
MNTIMETIQGFAVYQTPVSFLAGVGAHHLYCKFWRDRKVDDVQEES